MPRIARALLALPSIVAACLLAAPASHAASIDLHASKATEFFDSTTITGDVNGVAVAVRNHSSTSTTGSVRFDAAPRAHVLGVVTSSSSGGSIRSSACTRAAVTGATRHTCRVAFAAGSETLVLAIVGVAAPGAATLAFVATPGAGHRDPTPADARVSLSWRATGRTCTVLGANGAFGGAAASETLVGTAGNDVLCGFGGHDSCSGSFYGRLTCSSYQRDVVQGLGGDDVALLPAVNSVPKARTGDRIDLGDGTDTIANADSLFGAARATLGESATLAHRHGATWVTHSIASAEAYEGSPGVDTVFGTDAPETISGGGGDDELHAGAGDDLVLGGTGEDLMTGGLGVDRIDGGPGAFDAAGAGSGQASVVDLGAGTISSGGEVDSLVGVEGAMGTVAADTLIGTTRTNTFYASAGIDTVSGGGGIDVLTFERMRAGVRIDAATGSATSGTSRTASRGIEGWVGSPFADSFRGTAGIDVFDGVGGADVADGLADSDVLAGGAGNDVLRGGAGADELDGDAGRDTLSGGTGVDRCRQDPRSRVTDC